MRVDHIAVRRLRLVGCEEEVVGFEGRDKFALEKFREEVVCVEGRRRAYVRRDE